MAIRFVCENPQPVVERTLELRVGTKLLPTASTTAHFLEYPQPREIPGECDRVEIKPSSKTPCECEFTLPKIGGEGPRMISGREVEFADGRSLTIMNLTPRLHLVKSPSGGRINGVGGILRLNGLGSNATLKAVAGIWVITGAYNAELKN
jgi:hypothetical protein